MAFLFLGILSAILDWYAVGTMRRSLEIYAKPATLVFLILWYLARNPVLEEWISIFFLFGLVFSLAGDIFLMLPAKYFIAGLLAFLLAQITYILGFNASGLYFEYNTLISALLIIIIAILIHQRLRRALVTAGNHSLVLPITIYVLVISIMVWSASITLVRDEWSTLSALLVTSGAALFFASDAILAWNRFVESIRYGRLMNMILYHMGQYLIVAGVISRLGGL